MALTRQAFQKNGAVLWLVCENNIVVSIKKQAIFFEFKDLVIPCGPIYPMN